MWNGYFTNISVETWVWPSNMYGSFGLPDDLGGILVDHVKVSDGR